MLLVHVVCCLFLPGRLEVPLERLGGGGGRHTGPGDVGQPFKRTQTAAENVKCQAHPPPQRLLSHERLF